MGHVAPSAGDLANAPRALAGAGAPVVENQHSGRAVGLIGSTRLLRLPHNQR